MNGRGQFPCQPQHWPCGSTCAAMTQAALCRRALRSATLAHVNHSSVKPKGRQESQDDRQGNL